MGFFSWQCTVCDVSLRSIYATTDKDQIESVALMPNGSLIMGDYDGYGRIGGVDILNHASGKPECYHKKCWVKAGKPETWTEPSEHAQDQGYFYDED